MISNRTADNFYLIGMSVATSVGVGYEIASNDLFNATLYGLLTFIFAGEKIFRELDNRKETLEIKTEN